MYKPLNLKNMCSWVWDSTIITGRWTRKHVINNSAEAAVWTADYRRTILQLLGSKHTAHVRINSIKLIFLDLSLLVRWSFYYRDCKIWVKIPQPPEDLLYGMGRMVEKDRPVGNTPAEVADDVISASTDLPTFHRSCPCFILRRGASYEVATSTARPLPPSVKSTVSLFPTMT